MFWGGKNLTAFKLTRGLLTKKMKIGLGVLMQFNKDKGFPSKVLLKQKGLKEENKNAANYY